MAELQDISIRGGGLLGGFFKWVIGPIALLILPIVIVCGWASESDLTYLLEMGLGIPGIFLGMAILIDILSFFSFHLTLESNGQFKVSNMVKDKVNWDGNIHSITGVEMKGAICRFSKGGEIVSEWNTKPISLKNMKKFALALKSVNPRIKLDDKIAEIAEKGKDKKYQKSFLKGGGGVFLLSFAGALWFPTLEVLFLRLSLGKFTWFQISLLGPLFLTICIPYCFIFMGWAMIPDKWARSVKTSIGIAALSVALYFHVNLMLDFLSKPAAILHQVAQIQSIAGSRDDKDMIHFSFPAVSEKDWSIECYHSETPKVVALLKGGPVNMYYTRRTDYMVRLEDATGKSNYSYNRQ